MKKIFFTLICLCLIVSACLPKPETPEIHRQEAAQKHTHEKISENGVLGLDGEIIGFNDGLLQIATEQHFSFNGFNDEIFEKNSKCFMANPTADFIIAETKIIFEKKNSQIIDINNQDVELKNNQVKAVMFRNNLLFYITINNAENICISEPIEKLISNTPQKETRFTNDPLGVAASTIEVSNFPFGSEPTAEQQQAADELFEKSLVAARKNGWFNFDNAIEDGYERLFEDDLHFFNLEYTYDDEVLNPEKPEMLVYYETEKGRRLAGFMFTARTAIEHSPQIGGPLTVWHYHTAEGDLCLEDGLIQEYCPHTSENLYRSPEMIHVWFIDHKIGTFASSMDLYEDDVEQLLGPKFD